MPVSEYGQFTPSYGKRVEIHPRFDLWMQGDKYGDVADVRQEGKVTKVTVQHDKSGRQVTYSLDDLREV